MGDVSDSEPVWSPKTAGGRLRRRAQQAARARRERRAGAGACDPDESYEARRRRELLEVVALGEAAPSDSQTGFERGDLAGPPVFGPRRKPACPGFEENAEVGVARLDAGRAEDMGAGTLLYTLAIGNAVQIAIPGMGVLRTTPVRSISTLGPGSVQIVTRRSTYRLRLRPLAA